VGFLSKVWSKTKKAVSSGWDSTKDAITDITGVDSLNTLLLTGGLAMGPAQLSGKGILGEAFADALSPLTAVPPPLGGQQVSGPLMGNAPANLTMGTGGQPTPQTAQPSAQDLASLFGNTGYQYGPSSTSSALLQSNPEAYQYSPLMNGIT
jgi:hypothetical protein